MRIIHVYFKGFSEGYLPEDFVLPGPSGVLHVHPGIIPRIFRGTIEIREHESQTGYADLNFLKSVWSVKGPIYYRDNNNVTYSVLWTTPFDVQWDREDANIGTLTYELKEVFL